MYGPGTNLAHGGSLIFHSECQMRYITQCLEAIVEGGHRTMEPRVERYEDWHERSQRELQGLVWSQPSVEHSFFKNSDGRDPHPEPVAPGRLLDLDPPAGPGRLRPGLTDARGRPAGPPVVDAEPADEDREVALRLRPWRWPGPNPSRSITRPDGRLPGS